MEKLFCLHSKTCAFHRYCWCDNCRKEIKSGHVLLHMLKGVLLDLADLKPPSTANMFCPPRTLKIKPHRPYFNPSSWLLSIPILKVYTGPFLQPGDTSVSSTGTEIRKAMALVLPGSLRSVDTHEVEFNTTKSALSSVRTNHLNVNSVFQKDFTAPTKVLQLSLSCMLQRLIGRRRIPHLKANLGMTTDEQAHLDSSAGIWAASCALTAPLLALWCLIRIVKKTSLMPLEYRIGTGKS